MKNALIKDSLKEIKNTYKRFLSILLMAFLGVGFFAGIQATSPDMVNTIDKYYKDQQVYDVQIMSTLGLKDNDIQELSKINGVEKVIGTYETDGKIEMGEKEIVAKVLCLEDMNTPKLLQGRLPQSIDECVVEENFLTFNNQKIGDTIELDIAKSKNDNGEEIDYLKQNKLKIVGTVQSPVYISKDRGNSKLGAGKVNYYMYINKENINAKDIYTNLYVKVKDADNYTTSKDQYKETIQNVKNEIDKIKSSREQARKDELVGIATKKVDDAEKEFNLKKEEANKQIEDAENKLNEGKNKIAKAEAEINQNEKKANQEFSKAEKQLKDAKNKISQSENELNKKEAEANVKFQNLETQKLELQNNLDKINSGIQTINENYENILKTLQMPNLPDTQKVILETQKQNLENQKQELERNKTKIESGIVQIDSGILTGKKQLEEGKKQLQSAKSELKKQETTYQNKKSTTQKQIKQAKEQIENSKKELNKGMEELNSKRQEVNQQLQEAEKKLIDSRDQISKIEKPTWYILDRETNSGYASFIQDSKSIENIGKVFPAVFFIVATLISLTSMTRMVEEQRTQIGTLKALGYNKFQIASKYIIYASLACIIGGILGMCIGFVILPTIIWKMYMMIYQMTDVVLEFNFLYGGIGLGLILVCIVGATIYSIQKELQETPATLMRPKAPKIGKRVLLEKIPFIWKRLSFSRKVTVRNIFRYKKRVLMTIIGIMGCTSLILAGFGLKDSISAIMPSQYGEVFNYDMQINLKDGLTNDQIKSYMENLNKRDDVVKVAETYLTSTTVKNGDLEEDAQIIVPKENEGLKDLITIYDKKTKQPINLNNDEICLTDKAAQLLNVSVGDIVKLKDSDGNVVEAKIGNIVENYINHYVYMSKELYQKLYNEGILLSVPTFEYEFTDDYAHILITGTSRDPYKLYDSLKTEINKIQTEGVNKDDFERIKKMIYGAYVKEYNDVGDIARMFLSDFMKGINSFDYIEEIESIDSTLAKRIFDDTFEQEKMVISVVK